MGFITSTMFHESASLLASGPQAHDISLMYS